MAWRNPCGTLFCGPQLSVLCHRKFFSYTSVAVSISHPAGAVRCTDHQALRRACSSHLRSLCFNSCLQTWCGRLAMMGFLTSIIEEFVTGRVSDDGTARICVQSAPTQPQLCIEAKFSHKPHKPHETQPLTSLLTHLPSAVLVMQGTLAQMYLMEPGQPNYLVLGLLMAVFGGATIYGSVDTLSKIKNKKLSPR